MQNLFRRQSGVYVFRLAVPSQLRRVFGKSEIIESTGTRELAMAKIVVSALAAQWRKRFLDANRLIKQIGQSNMDYQEILRLANGSPILLSGGHLSIKEAAAASGVSIDRLLRAAGDGALSLFVRAPGVKGFLLRTDELELDDPELGAAGGYVIPTARQMPAEAVSHVCHGLIKIIDLEVASVTTALLAGEQTIDLVAFEIPDKPGRTFAPIRMIGVTLDSLEIPVSQVERLRQTIASNIAPERLSEARTLQSAVIAQSDSKSHQKADKKLSTLLNAYIPKLRQKISSEAEIQRIVSGCSLLIELDTDWSVSEIDPDVLRAFRDHKLSKMPANENKIRLTYRTTSVTESIRAVEGKNWPLMTTTERDKRMRWIQQWFTWMRDENWIAENPGLALRGESVITKAQRKHTKPVKREDEARDAFTPEDLKLIFSASWFQTGKGEITKQNTYRTFSPFKYWLPLLGLYAGAGRINELCQLYLSDIQRYADGVWLIEINEDASDKKLKNDSSRRTVPLHPKLIELGFGDWHAALLKAGHTRLFPELKYDEDKGYGKAATKWFSTYMSKLGIPRNGKKSFHSFRHTYINALPEDTPARISKQLAGHTRGKGAHDKVYKKDQIAAKSAKYVNRLNINLPSITPLDIEAGLKATADALRRKRDFGLA